MRIPNWLRLSLAPDELIGGHKMRRWWLLPQNKLINVYLHRHTGNDPRDPHDHPCDNISIRLRGELVEGVPVAIWREATVPSLVVKNPERSRAVHFDDAGRPLLLYGRLGRVTVRRAEDPHRLEMLRPDAVAWTIWIRFRNRRRWGFFEATGWRQAKTVRQP